MPQPPRPATLGTPAPRLDPVDAVIQAGAAEIHYRRAGTGLPVLLLAPRGTADGLGGFLFDALANRFRVIAPEPAVATGIAIPLSEWIRDVIDGLGLVQPSVVADPALGIPALGFALTDPERVGRLVLVRRDHVDPAAPADTLDDTLRQGNTPLLLLRAEARSTAPPLSPEQVDQMLAFLHGA